ncbi:helix-turn-helix transcriptional regulator [Pseudoroseicyclus aestuarii]|uniref:WYL domain-containing protein n=1 Tax=Pseudoroseicyclus aestuarii TaxID=1795041 RepID=A0A318T6J6_9RHOB|nr:WYL domain-containing protein [Pseudoroseicyclus aestuarii]PYE84008.1 WYL domain-containing protein [Pseudoroseicyclus aestuarii]
MARSDRLMRLMDVLRRLPAPVTAQRLAEETGISPRQLYRDIATLRAGGALIDGAAGLGYTLTEDPALPPQSFDRIEIEALVLAVSGLGTLGDPVLEKAGQAALARIVATLPDRQAQQAIHTVMRSFRAVDARPEPLVDPALLREACWEETDLLIHYRDLKERETERLIWPLGLSYGPQSLMLLAHCRLRMDFRVFHVARMGWARPGGGTFRPRRVGLLRDYVAARQAGLR